MGRSVDLYTAQDENTPWRNDFIDLNAIDAADLGAFHRRLLVYANAGLFCDGYILSSIGLALVTLTPAFHLTSVVTGLVGAATLLGILAGALIFGALTDLVGRRIMMIADLAVFVAASLLQFFVTNAWELILLRFILGVAIGADYPIAGALIAEYMPARVRGAAVNSMQVAWFVGAGAAYVVGYALLRTPESWRWILASSAIPALVGLLLRSSAPESVRWLLVRGRHAEAQAIVRAHFQDGALPAAPPHSALPWRAMFRRPFAGPLAFVSAMWLLQVVPLFAIYTFAPVVLSALHIGSASAAGSLAITAAFLLGSLLALPLVETWGRRKLCIAGFAVALIAFVLVLLPNPAVVVFAFIAYAIAIGAAAGLELVYPSELFPTSVRASATGFAAAVSRVGAFLGTFALPVALTRAGVAPIMWACAVLSALGLVVALLWAPETRGRMLDADV